MQGPLGGGGRQKEIPNPGVTKGLPTETTLRWTCKAESSANCVLCRVASADLPQPSIAQEGQCGVCVDHENIDGSTWVHLACFLIWGELLAQARAKLFGGRRRAFSV